MSDPADALLDALPQPLLEVDAYGLISFVNQAGEAMMRSSRGVMVGRPISDFMPFSTPVLNMIEQVRESGGPMREHLVDLSSPRIGRDVLVNVDVAPVPERPAHVLLLLQTRSIAEKLDRQRSNRGSTRSVTGLASMLAHEIKNPLAGIRGAAQLLQLDGGPEERELTRLITDETDRIVRLVDRMEVFADDRPVEHTGLNIHSVLEQVRLTVSNGFGSRVTIDERYDPSLPPVFGNRDLLMQVFLNLAKNACEAMLRTDRPRLQLSTRFRPGLHIATGDGRRVPLPLECVVADNGSGIPDDIATFMFDPFVTTKASGSGLGLALVAKIVGDHGGIIEHESDHEGTRFRVMLPMHEEAAGRAVRAEQAALEDAGAQ